MKKLIMLLAFVFVLNAVVRAQYGGEPGHLPFDHNHLSSCGASGGVCYGYAMGLAAVIPAVVTQQRSFHQPPRPPVLTTALGPIGG